MAKVTPNEFDIYTLTGDHERLVNLSTARMTLWIGMMQLLIPLIAATGLIRFDRMVTIALPLLGLLYLLSSGLVFLQRGKSPALKYILMAVLLIDSFVINALCGYHLWLIITLALLAAGRYNNTRLTIFSGVCAIVFSVLTAFFNALIANKLSIGTLSAIASISTGGLDLSGEWLYRSILEYGSTPHAVLMNSLRLITLPNAITIALISWSGTYFVRRDHALLNQFAEKIKLEGNLSAEQSLRERLEASGEYRESLYERLLQIQSCGILCYRLPDREIVVINDMARRLYDFPPEDELTREMIRERNDSVIFDDADATSAKLKLLKEPGSCVSYTLHIPHKDGSFVHVYATTQLIEMENGDRLIISSMLDISSITSLEQSNKRLREQMRITDALSNTYFSSHYVDLKKNTFMVMNTVDDILDTYHRSGPVRESLQRYIPASVRDSSRARMTEFCDPDTLAQRLRNTDSITADYESIRRGWCRAGWVVVDRDSSGDPEHLLFIVSDINESVKAEQAHKVQLQALNSALAERMSIIQSIIKTYFSAYYIDLEKDTYIELSSIQDIRSIMNPHGMAQESLYAMSQFLVREDHSPMMEQFIDLSNISERMRDTDILSLQYVSIKDSWSQIFFIAGDRDPDGTLRNLIVCARDIQEEKAREDAYNRELIAARDAAEAANKAKTIFLNNMSHDIRTPMNAILGFAHLMDGSRNDPALIGDYLKKIRESGEYLLSIINHVLDMARIDSGVTILDEDAVDLDSLHEVADIFRDEIAAKGLTFTDSVEIDHRYVFADKARLNQILINLVSNAVKYTPAGSVGIRVRELPCDRAEFARYEIKVTDTGIGMSPEFLEHIFDSFARERNTTESKIVGTGLGMSIVKKLIDLMGGTITVESELHRGTAITVVIDFRVTDTVDSAQPSDRNADLSILSGKHVLLVEDNDLNAEIATAILEDMDILVDRAEDGIVCLDMLANSRPGLYDLILMDIQMPNLNGYLTTEKIRRCGDPRYENIPIIAMTANAFDEDRKAAFEAGMNGHIAKPIDIDNLIKTMAGALSKR